MKIDKKYIIGKAKKSVGKLQSQNPKKMIKRPDKVSSFFSRIYNLYYAKEGLLCQKWQRFI